MNFLSGNGLNLVVWRKIAQIFGIIYSDCRIKSHRWITRHSACRKNPSKLSQYLQIATQKIYEILRAMMTRTTKKATIVGRMLIL